MTSVTNLRIEEFFAGHTCAHGLVEDRFGRVRRRFVVEIEGRVDGDDFVLEEDFEFDDGEKTHRTWRIRRVGPDGYEGAAADVVGMACGSARGNVLNWTYRLRLPIGGREFVVGFDDRMYLGADGTMLNIARMHKWGLTLGRVTIAFTRATDAERHAA
jgi:hypothetical protein